MKVRSTLIPAIIFACVAVLAATWVLSSGLRGMAQREQRMLAVSPSSTAFVAQASASTPSSGSPTVAPSTPVAAAAVTPFAAAATTPVATPAASTSATSPTAIVAASTDAKSAVQALIQKANQEQQDAFTKSDPTLMKDTATTDYYNQLRQINRELANGGVSAISLVRLEWGPITVTNATSATATTFETWRTTFVDGSTDESRDRNVYTLVKDQNSWKIQSDDHPDSDVGAGEPPGQVAPAPPGQIPRPRTVPSRPGESNNWSGYAASGGTFTGVAGTWVIPQPNSTGSFGSGATWVGIGGMRSRDLIQAGTEETTNGSGQIRFDAWLEMLPRPSQRVSLAVNPGDSVSVSIDSQGNDKWQIAFKNNTTGKSYQTTVTYQSSLSSAEWVEEAPSARRRLLPLEDFGTVKFADGSAIENGKKVTIAQAGARPITMIDLNGDPIAKPSALSGDGSGFSIDRVQSTATPQPRRQIGGFRPTFGNDHFRPAP